MMSCDHHHLRPLTMLAWVTTTREVEDCIINRYLLVI